ncbi:DUF397 domain-containing protein [Actinomadura sp. BRA 177]|uniref:DUF397 domain-containing protein n=1 Tax=Actinomadura sp. BRA 177 TaxID=2745202 RepID=UPI0015960FC5|nr:DUF397 domain-containing protein [Actinomadura sp. BRA 177]NVI85957.1 DUF397 domain-containing protein [Actinomadura sp. BRA 177]
MNRSPNWHKSRHSGPSGDNCVEVATIDDHIAVRDSERPTDVLMMSRDAWRVFVGSLQAS